MTADVSFSQYGRKSDGDRRFIGDRQVTRSAKTPPPNRTLEKLRCVRGPLRGGVPALLLILLSERNSCQIRSSSVNESTGTLLCPCVSVPRRMRQRLTDGAKRG